MTQHRRDRFLDALWPSKLGGDRREHARAAVGAAIAVLVTALACHAVAKAFGFAPWLIAPIGASAVLVFALPASPLAQPWAVVGGNTLSALVGVACATLVPEQAIAGGLAIGLAIGLMFLLRCLHPPGGAVALLVVMTPAVSPRFAFFPVMANSLLLVAAGVAYNSLTGRRYPHGQRSAPTPAPRFAPSDLDAALAHYNQVLDVSRDDLEVLLTEAQAHAYGRRLGRLRCADIMSRDVIAADYAMPLQEAWQLLRDRRIKALPVIDQARRIVGIVTVADFMRHAGAHVRDGLSGRLRALLRPSGSTHTDKAEVVGQIMTRQVRVSSEDQPVVDLLPLFSEGGHHHLPIIDAEQRLCGILTQTDLVRALYRAGP
jgi:CBS domain-containing membrane protein